MIFAVIGALVVGLLICAGIVLLVGLAIMALVERHHQAWLYGPEPKAKKR